MKFIFIVNPHAGKLSSVAKIKEKVGQLFEEKEFEIWVTSRPGEATQLANKASLIYEGVTVVACGGDGTMNEVAQGLKGTKNTTLAVYPCGTGNDFVRSFTNAHVFSDLSYLKEGKTLLIDSISCGQKVGLNVCCVGFDATVASQVSKFKTIPLVSSNGAYLISVFYSFLTKMSFPLQVEIDGVKRAQANYLLACVTNGLCYGGGFHPSPNSSMTDGLLDLVLVKKISRRRIVSVIQKYKKGNHIQNGKVIDELKDIIEIVRCREAKFLSPVFTSVNIDGESVQGRRIHFKLLPQSVKLLLPADCQPKVQ